MRSIIIEQAHSNRTRADFYRNLARTMINSPFAADLERSARMLDERVRELECYASACSECADEDSDVCPMTMHARALRPSRTCTTDIVVFNAIAKSNQIEKGDN